MDLSKDMTLSARKQLSQGVIVLAFLCAGCSSVHNDNVDKNDSRVNVEDSQKDEKLVRSDIQKLIASEEKAKGIPKGILNSIAAVESQHDVYAVNARKKSHKFKTKAEAISFIKRAAKSGEKNISVGCLQLHYGTHKKNFASVEDMLSPKSNVAYAAMLLRSLYDKYGSWERAIKKYHNSKEQYSNLYYRKVMRAYGTSQKLS